LKSLLSSDDKKSITKKHRNKGITPLDIVLIECAIDELKDKTKEELLSYFSSKQGMNIHDFYKVCTMIAICPDFIIENSKTIKSEYIKMILYKNIHCIS
ncbi:MAG: hypothetical protein RSC38_06185, partial [Oscillospiraceae bacterium]